jgi:hypothetical protein
MLGPKNDPLVGARPLYTPGSQPPLEPNADCTTQPETSLAAQNAPAAKPDHSFSFGPAQRWTAAELKTHLQESINALRGSR